MKHIKLFEEYFAITEAKFKAGQVWLWKHADGDKNVEIIEIKPNGDVVAREDGKSDKFIVRDANKLLKKKITESIDEAVYVPSNILDFTKRKGSYATSLVKKAATWAEKSGKRISGGTAIGKDYMTIILDMKYQGSEIYISLNKETIKLFGEEVTDAKSFAKVLSMNESVVIESHFKVGDKVKMSHGGTGVIVSLDKEDGAEDEKYYNVELPNGDMHKHAPNELTKESVVVEAMSFEELKNKFEENPYGIGAQLVVYEEGKNGNPDRLIFKHDEKHRRDQIESRLKTLGIPSKKMSKSTAEKSFKYRYELILFESLDEAKIQKFIESLSASKEAKNILHNLDVFAQLNPDYSPVEAIAYIEEGLKTSGNAIKKAKKISDLLYTAGILASDVEVFGRDVLSIITDGIAGKLAESETNEGLSSQDMKALRYLQVEQDPKKIEDLQKAVGKEFYDNSSSTGKSILVDVKEKGGKFVAITKEAKSKYNDKIPKKGETTDSISITWNAMFY